MANLYVTLQVFEERKDSETLSKCLIIVCNMVESADITVMNPTLHSLHENLVLQCLRSENPAVRNEAVRALGLFCLLSKDLAHHHLALFMQVGSSVHVYLSCLCCILVVL